MDDSSRRRRRRQTGFPPSEDLDASASNHTPGSGGSRTKIVQLPGSPGGKDDMDISAKDLMDASNTDYSHSVQPSGYSPKPHKKTSVGLPTSALDGGSSHGGMEKCRIVTTEKVSDFSSAVGREPVSVAEMLKKKPTKTAIKKKRKPSRNSTTATNKGVSFNAMVCVTEVDDDEPIISSPSLPPPPLLEEDDEDDSSGQAPNHSRRRESQATGEDDVDSTTGQANPNESDVDEADSTQGSFQNYIIDASLTNNNIVSATGEIKMRRIPPAKLTAAERAAKKEAALREAKEAAKKIRRESKNKGNKLGGFVDDASENDSILSPATKKRFSFNPFRKGK